MGERPDDPLERQTPGDHRIFIHITIVVVIDELVTQRLAENRQVIAARKMQTPRTSQRSFKPAGRHSDSGERESATPGISPAGETGAPERTAGAFFFDPRLMGLNT